ncbi:hypothetical protein Pfo_001495 [Paulownia fortunei]|nr:hypothetical protein Pfo_001495 [Paulownia fortunei]
MVFSKNSIASLAILSLFLLLLIFSLDPLTCKPFIEKDELQIALEKAAISNRTVIVAIINRAYVEPHKNEFPSMFDLFLEGFWAGEETRPLVDHLLVVSMDKIAHERCQFRRLNCYRMAAGDGGEGGDDFAGENVYMSDKFIEMMWRRTLFLLNLLKRGYSFIFTDVDVLWLRNPFTRLTKNKTIDLQISTDIFNGDSFSENNLINTGFYFIKSNKKTISLFEKWYNMRKNSTGLKEQDVLENLVRHGVLGELGVKARFLDTLYFSGFCSDSKDVRMVATVHANCCRTIGAKVVDLKAVLRDWKGFRNKENNDINRQYTRYVNDAQVFHFL